MILCQVTLNEPPILPRRCAGSPSDMTRSKSSKSSSFHSSLSDPESVLTDSSHFEDICIDDVAHSYCRDVQQLKCPSSPYAPSFASDCRAKSLTNLPQTQPQLSLSKSRSPRISQREITTSVKRRPSFTTFQPNSLSSNVRGTNTNQLLSESYINPVPLGGHTRPNSRPSVPCSRRQRTPSPSLRHFRPSLSINPQGPGMSLEDRRSSWHSSRERKTEAELEKECDEDDDDDIPDGFVLDNVPLSPRPQHERIRSQPPSKSSSPERSDRPSKPRVRSVGNGTPAGGGESGSIGALRSPSSKSDSALSSVKSPVSRSLPSPVRARAERWNVTLAGLNKDAQELTEKLEEHSDELEIRSQRSSTGSIPQLRRASTTEASRLRHKSALAELPPLRRSNVMIDPLPISKEKEAVLSRTRPSWLPPKDPAEERRHLREYQKMMQKSLENERRREEQRIAMSANKDTAADSLMQTWENEIVPRWNEAIRERRTRELWWRGVAPRSRGFVWAKAIGNHLGLTEKSYEAALGRAQEAEGRQKAGLGRAEDRTAVEWIHTIRKDVEEQTWRDLRIFQAGGPLHQSLLDVLSAYAMYRSDIGYVTGCNTIAALLLLNLPTPATAFIALANILNRPLPLSFYSNDQGAKSSTYNLLLRILATKSPRLHHHLTALPNHDTDAYMADMFTSLFTGQVALDEAARLWDVYIFEGDSVLVRASVAVLLEHEMTLLGSKNIVDVRTAIYSKKRSLVGRPGDEERWMMSVREAGKHK